MFEICVWKSLCAPIGQCHRCDGSCCGGPQKELNIIVSVGTLWSVTDPASIVINYDTLYEKTIDSCIAMAIVALRIAMTPYIKQFMPKSAWYCVVWNWHKNNCVTDPCMFKDFVSKELMKAEIFCTTHIEQQHFKPAKALIPNWECILQICSQHILFNL